MLSIDAQLAELREYAAREKLFVIEELVEKQSAKVPGRLIFTSMIDRIEKEEASGIVSWHPDRLARNSVDGGRLIYLVDTGKIKSLKFPQFWFEATPQGKFMLSIAFGQSKYFVDSLSENTKRGLRQKVRRGEMPALAPIGYLNDVRNKTIVIDKKKAPVIKELFEKFSTGKYLFKDVTRFLAKNGITTKGGHLMRHRIKWILTNPFYYGHFRYAGEIYEGIHKPVITKKLFDQVQEVIRRKDKPWKNNRIPKPFLGLFHCKECGMMITGEDKTKFYKGTNRTVTYIYYRCTKKSKTIKCLQPFVRQEELDHQISNMIQKVSLPQAWADRMFKRLDEEEKESTQSCFAFVQEKRKEIQTIKEKLQFLLDSYLDQIIEREVYLQKKSELLSQKKSLEEKIIRFEQKQNDWLGPMREWVKDAAGAANIARDKDLNAKKVLAQKIFGSDLTLFGKKAHGEALPPWAARSAAPTSRNWEPRAGIGPAT